MSKKPEEETVEEQVPVAEPTKEESQAAVEAKLLEIRKLNLDLDKIDMNLQMEPLVNKDVFKNRRRMAWISLLGIFAIGAINYFWIVPGLLENYSEVTSWLLISLSTVVVSYMGSTVLGSFMFRNRK